jgi:putative FmdB family regulatory protein
MPIYEYVCMRCEHHFEELVRADETPSCPACAAESVTKKFSVVAPLGARARTSSGGGGGGGCCGGSCGC